MSLYPSTRSGRRYGLLGVAGAAYSAYNNASPQTRRFVDSIPSRVRTGIRQGIDRFSAFSRNRVRSRFSRVRGNNIGASFRAGMGGRSSRMSRGRRRRSIRKGGRRGRRGRPRRKRGFNMLGHLYKKICTPMGYHTTLAYSQPGVANQRQLLFHPLGSEKILNFLGLKRPANFLFDSNTAGGGPALTNPGNHSWQLSIDRFVHDLRLQNRSNASMELKIYECVYRHDVTAGQISNNYFPSGISVDMFDANDNPSALAGQPGAAVGPAQPAFPTGMAHEYSHPAWTPFQSPTFVAAFRIVKTHSLKLGPNEIVSRKFSLRPKKFKGLWLESTESSEYVARWSKFLLYSWVGMPVDDGTLTNQGKAKCDLFWQDNVHINYHFLPGTTELENYGYTTNDINVATNQYKYDPAAFTHVIPASDTIETVAAPADTVAEVAP